MKKGQLQPLIQRFTSHYTQNTKKRLKQALKSQETTMYKQPTYSITQLNINNSYEGVTIEQRIRLIMNNKEPITDGAPLIYTERKDGVMPEYDIRTDRWEVAIDAMDKISKTHQAKREERIKKKEEERKPQPIQATGTNETQGQTD